MHCCGHPRRHHVGGWCVADEDRAAARLARKRCPACTATDAETLVADPALPSLAGSPRQVAWAEAIRRDRLAAIRRIDPVAAARVAAVVEARWWIDRRSVDPRFMATA